MTLINGAVCTSCNGFCGQATTSFMHNSTLDTIEEATEEIGQGRVVIVVDDRENEGDMICAAECVTPDTVNFFVTAGRGLTGGFPPVWWAE